MPPGNPAKVTDVVEARILPLFDFNHMTRIAMARNWRRATPEQQAMLTADFTTLLVRIYFTALSGQGDPVIEFKRLRTASEDTEVTVISVIKPPGGSAADYGLRYGKNGNRVEGLIKSFSEKNQQGHTHLRSRQVQNIYVPVIFRSLLLGIR